MTLVLSVERYSYGFQQAAEGWKVAITEAVVNDYIRQSADRASNP